ncbi:MAG: hypothetical protein ACTS6G_06395 [Candidatus Hodgkinia cicadicola]
MTIQSSLTIEFNNDVTFKCITFGLLILPLKLSSPSLLPSLMWFVIFVSLIHFVTSSSRLM